MSYPKHTVVKIDKKTGEILEHYESISAAAQADDVRANSIEYMCRNKALGTGLYCYRYADDSWQDENWKNKKNCPVWIFDLVAGVLYWASTRNDAAERLLVHETWITRAINDKCLVHGRFRIVEQSAFGQWNLLKGRLAR